MKNEKQLLFKIDTLSAKRDSLYKNMKDNKELSSNINHAINELKAEFILESGILDQQNWQLEGTYRLMTYCDLEKMFTPEFFHGTGYHLSLESVKENGLNTQWITLDVGPKYSWISAYDSTTLANFLKKHKFKISMFDYEQEKLKHLQEVRDFYNLIK